MSEDDLDVASPKTEPHPAPTSSDISTLIEVPHPSEFIREEMDERDWGIPTMARKMGGDYGVNVLALQMYLSLGEREPNMRLGDSMSVDIAKAFGVSVEFVRNMEASWLRYEERRKAVPTNEMGAARSDATSNPPQDGRTPT